MVTVATADAKLCMPLKELIDVESERARISKDLEKAEKELEFVKAKLANESFISKAPEKVVNDIREREAKITALIQNLKDMLSAL